MLYRRLQILVVRQLVHEQSYTTQPHPQSSPDMPPSIRNTRQIWTETFKNRVSLAGFSLDSRSLAVLLHIAKDSLLLSKLQAVRFYRARIFSYQDRLDYERSPELVHLLVAVLSALQRAKTPIYVEAWAGFEAFTTAVRTVDYDRTSFSVVAVTGFDKRDMMDRTWDELRVLQPQSVCLDAAKHWGPGNHHLHDPACGKKLAGLDELMATVSRTVETLTVRQSWPSYDVCHSCSLDFTFTRYLRKRLLSTLTAFKLHEARLEGDACLANFLGRHSATLKTFQANKAAIVEGFWAIIFEVLLDNRNLERLRLDWIRQHAFRNTELSPAWGRWIGGLTRSTYPQKPISVNICGRPNIHTYLQASIDDFPGWLRERNDCVSLLGCQYLRSGYHEYCVTH